MHRLNVDATWEVTQQVAHRWMIPQRGGFVAFLGFSPRPSIPSVVHSSMARNALESLAAGIAQEWSMYGIRAVCVAAGIVQTEGLLQYGGQPVVDAFAEQVPMRRPAHPEEIAAIMTGVVVTGRTTNDSIRTVNAKVSCALLAGGRLSGVGVGFVNQLSPSTSSAFAISISLVDGRPDAVSCTADPTV